MTRLFLVAPHSFCDEKVPVRHCDRVATAAVDALKAAAGSRIVGTPLMSDAFRQSDYDYNRPNTDGTAWRAQLRAAVRKSAPDFVLEVHSFPGEHSLYNNWGRAALVLYWSPLNADFVDELATKISYNLKLVGRGDLAVSVQTPWHPVAITDDMRDLGQMHTLFEFNEDMPRENIPVIATAIIRAIDQMPRRGGADSVTKKWLLVAMVVIAILVVALIALAVRSPASMPPIVRWPISR